MKVDAKAVQEILGHVTFSVALGFYGYVSPSIQRDATDGMDGIFGEEKDAAARKRKPLFQIRLVPHIQERITASCMVRFAPFFAVFQSNLNILARLLS